jgi:hypothetical protein
MDYGALIKNNNSKMLFHLVKPSSYKYNQQEYSSVYVGNNFQG